MLQRTPVAGLTAGYRTYVLIVLTLIYVVNYLDRQILAILMPQIKVEFGLNFTEVGYLIGPAFAIVYAVLGVPLAVLADRYSRRNIIAVSLAVFSLMTVVSSLTRGFWTMALARFGTGVGEAGTGPSINSIIADLYAPAERATALSFYTAGLNIGLLLAFFGGGWIAEHYGWRVAIVAAGVPGLVLVLVLLVTVREPVRGLVEALPDSAPPSFWSVVRCLWSQRSFRWMSIGTSFSAFGGYAAIAFIPSFLKIAHHMTPAQIGASLALLTGIAGALGTYLAGVFADRLGRRDVRWNMYVPIVASFVAVPFIPVFYLADSLSVALAAAIIPVMMGATYVGPAYAMAQALVPLRMRARAVAILLLILNIIGLGLGPPVVGKVADLLQPWLGADALRYAMQCTILTSLIGAFCYWRATRTLRADLARGSYTAPESPEPEPARRIS
ncbi:MAG TPA: MFS transporter [Rhizomicrobium sp.]|nr:MFS transporter [Rhizomicrobium sp.]